MTNVAALDPHPHQDHVHGPACQHGPAPVLAPGKAPVERTALRLETIVDHLVERQVLTSRDIVDHGIVVEDRSRRNTNFRIQYGQEGVIVKQPVFSASDLSMLPFVYAEARILRALNTSPSCRRMRGRVPAVVDFDETNAALVTQLVNPATSVTRMHMNGGRIEFAEDVAVSAARLLATFHNATPHLRTNRHLRFNADPPLLLGVPAFAANRARIELPSRAFMRELDARPSLTEHFRSVTEEWVQHDDVIHGDARWDNYLVTAGSGPGGDLNLRLIDWELVGKGDALADVVLWMADYYRFRLESLNRGKSVEAADLLASPQIPPSSWHASSAAFWNAYATRRRWKPATRKRALERLGRYMPCAFTLLAYEFLNANVAASIREPVNGIVKAALQLADRAQADTNGFVKEAFDLE